MNRPLASILFSAVFITGCGSPPQTASGRKLKLETVTHDWQTTYVYRPVDEPRKITTKRPAPPATKTDP